VCLRERGQQTCAPLLSAVPYLRSATDEASLRAAIDSLYTLLDGSTDGPLGGTAASWFFEQERPMGEPPRTRYASYIMRSYARLGGPLEGYLNADDRTYTPPPPFFDWLIKEATPT